MLFACHIHHICLAPLRVGVLAVVCTDQEARLGARALQLVPAPRRLPADASELGPAGGNETERHAIL